MKYLDISRKKAHEYLTLKYKNTWTWVRTLTDVFTDRHIDVIEIREKGEVSTIFISYSKYQTVIHTVNKSESI